MGTSVVAPYPHLEIRVDDLSSYTPINVDVLPLHRPAWFLRAERGRAGIPVWCPQYTDAVKEFGAKTFDEASDFYSPEAFFLKQTFPSNGAFIIRLVPGNFKDGEITYDGATKASVIVEAKVVIGTVEVNPTTHDVEPGATITVQKQDVSKFSDKKARTVPYTEGSDTIYPLFQIGANTFGEWGNNVGIELQVLPQYNTQTRLDDVKSIMLTMKAVEKNPETGLYTVYSTSFGTGYTNFVVKPNTKNSDGLKVSADDVLALNYQGNYALPYNIEFFSDNWRKAGNAVAPLEKATITDAYSVTGKGTPDGVGSVDYDQDDVLTENPWGLYVKNDPSNSGAWPSAANLEANPLTKNIGYMVNLLTCVNPTTNTKYNNIKLSDDSFDFGASAYLLLSGGTEGVQETDFYMDGDIKVFAVTPMQKHRAHQARIVSYLESGADGVQWLKDRPRFPMTHFIDPGYAPDTKDALIAYLAQRDDIKVITAADVLWKDIPNNADDDIKSATRLCSQYDQYPESIEKGTPVCRGAIMLQAGKPIAECPYDYVPFTLWYAVRKAQAHNGQTLAQEPRGLPWSENDLFKRDTINWVPTLDDTKQLGWNARGNYCQYYSMTNLHYPALQSVYANQSSALKDDLFTDAVVYTKHALYQLWAKYAGRNDPAAELEAAIEFEGTQILSKIYNGKYTFTIDAYQTAEEKLLGYVTHLAVNLTCPNTMRTMVVDINVLREGVAAQA